MSVFRCCAFTERFEENISKSAVRVPNRGEGFIIVDENKNNSLHANLALFPNRTEHNFDPNEAWLYIYNAMLNEMPGEQNKTFGK